MRGIVNGYTRLACVQCHLGLVNVIFQLRCVVEKVIKSQTAPHFDAVYETRKMADQSKPCFFIESTGYHTDF